MLDREIMAREEEIGRLKGVISEKDKVMMEVKVGEEVNRMGIKE